jgi:catalase
MSDRAIPRSYRMMQGFGVHTFRLVNAEGVNVFCKFHWQPLAGTHSLVWEESNKIMGADPDFHRRDLWEAIEAGAYPQWELGLQIFTEAQAETFPFDVLDATKIVPEELVPVQIVGRMVLDRWPDNFFAETEQVAYCPANMIPGIDFSNDPLLQGRLFSYLDTQLSRLGGPNFHQIPVNAPKCPFANHQRDAHMQTQVPKGRVAYEPNSLDAGSVPTGRETSRGFRSFAEPSGEGGKGRIRAESFADHFSQPRLFFNSQTAQEQAHLIAAIVFELSKVETPAIRERTIGQLRNIDDGIARRVAAGLGMAKLPPAIPAAAKTLAMKPSPALGLVAKSKPTLQGRCVAILIADGSDGPQVDALRKAAQAAGAAVKLVAPTVNVTLKNGKSVAVDGQLAGTPSVLFDAVASVLDPAEALKLSKQACAVDWFRDAFGHLKAIAACQGTQQILKAGGITPDAAVVDPKEVKKFIELAKTRHWSREAKVRALP